MGSLVKTHFCTSDLQIHSFLEWGPGLEWFVFTEMIQKESLAKWFPSDSHQGHVTSVRKWPPGALPTEFCVGPVQTSVWFVGSAPGDSQREPGLRTWLLVHLWELRPSFSPRRGSSICLAGLGPGESVSSHGLCEQRVRSSLWGVNNQEVSSQAGLQVGSDCSWISPETGQERWVFSAFQGPSV